MIHSWNKVEKLETSLLQLYCKRKCIYDGSQNMLIDSLDMAKPFMVYVHLLYIDTLFFLFLLHEKHYISRNHKSKNVKGNEASEQYFLFFTYLENE